MSIIIPKKNTNYSKIALYLLIFLIFIFSLVFIYKYYSNKGQNKVYEVGATIPVNNEIKTDTLANPFSFDKAKIGDVVSGLEIIKIESLNGDDMPTKDNLKIMFKNKKLVTGKVTAYQDGPLAGKICLDNYDPYEQKNLPRLINDPRLLFVCFNNLDKAQTLLEKAGPDNVSVYIDNYTINFGLDDSLNFADLID